MARRSDIVRLLVEKKAAINYRNKFGHTALLWATSAQDKAIVSYLLHMGANPNVADEDGITPLHLAVRAGDNAIVKELLAAGANPDPQDKYGSTPLVAAASGKAVDCVRSLVGARADLNLANREGADPLLLAVWFGSYEIAKMLVEHGAHPDAQNAPRNDTPLLVAVYKNRPEHAELLAAHGARINVTNARGVNSLAAASPDCKTAMQAGHAVWRRKQAAAQRPDVAAGDVDIGSLADDPFGAARAGGGPAALPRSSPEPSPSGGSGSGSGAAGGSSGGGRRDEVEQYMEEQFAKIVGMDSVKDQLRAFYKKVKLDKIREAAGKMPGAEKNRLFHMIFMGPPGTGKTTMANLVARVMLKLGLLRTDKVVVVNNALDLVAGYVGQTPGKVDAKVDEAKGGVLFIDEAYSIVKGQGGSESSFGREAIDTIMKHMDPPACVFILAGYERQMNEFLTVNEGLSRRIPYRYHFEAYSTEQLQEILTVSCKHLDEDLEPGAADSLLAVLEKELTVAQRESQNAGLVANWIAFAQHERDDRLSIEEAKRNPDLASLLTLQDFLASVPALKKMAAK
jgi:hypothetical protein